MAEEQRTALVISRRVPEVVVIETPEGRRIEVQLVEVMTLDKARLRVVADRACVIQRGERVGVPVAVFPEADPERKVSQDDKRRARNRRRRDRRNRARVTQQDGPEREAGAAHGGP